MQKVASSSAAKPHNTTTGRAQGVLLPRGPGGLPDSPIHGCPELVPCQGSSCVSQSGQVPTDASTDAFVFMTDTEGSHDVLNIDAQVLTASLGATSEGNPLVTNVDLMYNADKAPAMVTAAP